MTGSDFLALTPLIVLALTPFAAMLSIMIRRSHGAVVTLTIAGLAASFGTLWAAATVAPRQVTPLLVIDSYSLFYTGLIVAATLAVVLLSYGYLELQAGNREELYILLTVAALGSAVLASSSHFASFFLGLEILSVPLYGLIAYLADAETADRSRPEIPGAGGCFGRFPAVRHGADLRRPRHHVLRRNRAPPGIPGFLSAGPNLGNQMPGRSYELLVPGTVLILTGIGFKLAVVPFHLWTPGCLRGRARAGHRFRRDRFERRNGGPAPPVFLLLL